MKFVERNSEEYNLSVSQFAKLCNTTRDTLRHYYEIGILLPRIDEKNGYHYYSPSQLSSFYFINAFRQAGCSLAEINELITDASKEKINATAHDKILEMQKEQKILEKKIDTLNTSLWLLKNYDQNKNKPPHLVTLDASNQFHVFRTPVSDIENSHHVKDIATDIMRHLEKTRTADSFSSFPIGVTMKYDDLQSSNYVYNCVISITRHTPDDVDTFPLPSARIVSAYHDHTKNDINTTYRQIMQFIEKKKLTICSDLHIISLINLYDSEEKHTYFKWLFICVK